MSCRRVSLVMLLVAVTVFGLACGAQAALRAYFIQAEDFDDSCVPVEGQVVCNPSWDYAPTNLNLVHCMDSPSAPCAIPDPWTDSHTFPKARYVQYRDSSFTTRVAPPGSTGELPWGWLGVLGPIIRAEVGDTVKVHFRNRSSRGNFGMHPHGFRYTKDNEGAFYTGANSEQPPGSGTQIPPGGEFTYTWFADTDSGPALGDVSSKVWWYHSHVDEPFETNLGLLGPIIITARGLAKETPSGPVPRDVDKEFVAAFFIFNELDGNEPGLMHSINGYIFGNLKGLVMKRGDRVRWHLLGMGNEVDLHTPHWHGKTLTVGRGLAARRTDVVELLPATMITADMDANNVGEWLFHCHVADHIAAGMLTTWQVTP